MIRRSPLITLSTTPGPLPDAISVRGRTWSTRILAVTGILALVLAACGGDGDGADDAAPTDPSEDVADAEEPEDAEEAEAPETDAETDAENDGESTDPSPLAGETVTFIVPYGPGGGFDTQARLVAPYLEEELDATIVVENMPGAGGVLGINQMSIAEPDGLTIGLMNAGGIASAVLAGEEGVNFELDDLSYVGRIGGGPVAMVSNPENELDTFDDVLATEGIRFASSGVGTSDYVTPLVTIEVFDLPGEIITGHDGTPENVLAVLRGDAHAMTGPLDTLLPNITSGEVHPLILFGSERSEDLPDVPLAIELEDLDDEQLAVLEAHSLMGEFHRVLVAPSGIPEDRMAALRAALDSAMNNPDLAEEAEAQGFTFNYMPGEEAEVAVPALLDAHPRYRELLVEGSQE